MSQNKPILTILFLACLVALMFLAAVGLSNLRLQPGQPFSLGERQEDLQSPYALETPAGLVQALLQGFMAVLFLLLPIGILLQMRTPEGRKKLFGYTILLALIFLAMNFAAESLRERPAQPPQVDSQGTQLAPPPEAPETISQSEGSPPPTWMVYGLSLGLAMLILAVVFLTVRFLWSARRTAPARVDRIAQTAQAALDALEAGGDLKDIILRCYARMGQVLDEERGIRRDSGMTPAEFEQLLLGKDIPEVPVRSLTRLFEAVRYGRLRPGKPEEQQALDSLKAIVAACGRN